MTIHQLLFCIDDVKSIYLILISLLEANQVFTYKELILNTTWRIVPFWWARQLGRTNWSSFCRRSVYRWAFLYELLYLFGTCSCREQSSYLDILWHMFVELDNRLVAREDLHILQDRRTRDICDRWLRYLDRTESHLYHGEPVSGSGHLRGKL